MTTIEDLFESGKAIGALVFGLLMMILILSADSQEVAVERFARAITALMLTIAPTSPVAIVITVIAVLVGGISVSKVKGPVRAKAMLFIAIWFFLSLSLNYLAAPV